MEKLNDQKEHKLQHWQVIALLLVLFDAVAVNAAFFGALWLRFDLRYSAIDKVYLGSYYRFAPIYTVLSIAVFHCFKMYNSLWRFASYHELLHVIKATAVTFVIQCVGITVFFHRMPIPYYAVGIMLQFCLTIGVRFSYRFIQLLRGRSERGGFQHRCMVIGAGNAGSAIIRDVINGGSDNENKICCVIDDLPNKWGRYIDNIPIVGGRDEIFNAVEKYHIDRIFFAIPTATAEQRKDILQICNETGCEVKQLPGIYQLVSGQVKVSSLRNVPIEDLLGREPIKADMSGVFQFIHGRTVLVTGGGGSIGSELCRQVAAHEPKRLIIFDVYENNAYSIQLELRKKYPELDLVTLIGSVRDSRRLDQVFATYKPDVVYHAAAHKHVPLMEDSPCESIKNNVMGTYKTAWAALNHGTERFVLISTDKAVNPTNIMGASKRLCEMVVQTFDYAVRNHKTHLLPNLYTHAASPVEAEIPGQESLLEPTHEAKTSYVAVRFGNVLGSNGSVVPLFKRQIEQGGPVTVTHPDIIRYFMTVPEAVSLVMLAGTYAKGGEIFVLDMGSPVKIADLARNLIRLSGLVPDEDIKIEYTGLRPGEKLYEEKLMAEEGLEKTENELIHIGKPIDFDRELFLRQLEELEQLAYENKETELRPCVQRIVSTYHPAANSTDPAELAAPKK